MRVGEPWWSDYSRAQSGQLVVLCGLDCCRFPLTWTTGYGIWRGALKDFLIIQTVHFLSPWPGSIQFPLDSQDHTAQPAQPFFACWFLGVRSPEWPSGILSSQFSGIIIVFPDGSVPSFGTKISKPSEHKTGSKNFADRSLGVIVSDATPISTSWFLDPWILGMREIAPRTRCWLRAYTDFWRTSLEPCKLSSFSWHCESLIDCCIVLSRQCFRMLSNMVRPVNSMVMGPLLHFISCEVHSLIRSSAV